MMKMKKLSELLPEKRTPIPHPEDFDAGILEGDNYLHDQATKALNAIDPTKIRFKAKIAYYDKDCYIKGFYLPTIAKGVDGAKDKIIHRIAKLNGSAFEIDPSTLQILIEE